MKQRLLPFEQEWLAAAQAANDTQIGARAKAKRQEELAILDRQIHRAMERRQRTPDQFALCCLYFYTRSPRNRERDGCWHHCVRCGQPLRYFDTYEQAQANCDHECKRQ